jgi:hypothetical protein
MKFSFAFLVPIFTGVSANSAVSIGDITADSQFGKKLLSQARNLANNNNNAVDTTWVSGYSLKFQGCHDVKQWNAEANEAEDVRIETKRLVRFRLCPTDSCTAANAGGCKNGYGDYIIDMNTFLGYYVEALNTQNENVCANMVCSCDGAEDADYCKYECYAAADLAEVCGVNNPNNGNNNNKQFKLEEYVACAKYNQNHRRRLAENGVQYYIGPYCSDQGGSIFMGLFSDDTCSEFADDYFGMTTFKTLTGTVLPYGSQTLLGSDCLSCAKTADDGTTSVGDECSGIYSAAGKCESNLASGTVSEPNTNACSYIDGIKIIRKDGMIYNASSRPNQVATAFIVIFAMSFCALAFYIWYLRMRLGKKRSQLL